MAFNPKYLYQWSQLKEVEGGPFLGKFREIAKELKTKKIRARINRGASIYVGNVGIIFMAETKADMRKAFIVFANWNHRDFDINLAMRSLDQLRW